MRVGDVTRGEQFSQADGVEAAVAPIALLGTFLLSQRQRTRRSGACDEEKYLASGN